MTLALGGVGVAVTRAEARGGPLSRRFSLLGARVLHWQAVEIAPPLDPEPLSRAAASWGTYDWIVFGSVNAVRALAAAIGTRPTLAPGVFAVGRATAAAAARAGFLVRHVPRAFGAAELVASLGSSFGIAGTRILLPASAIAGPVLERELAALGAVVDRVTAYRTIASPVDVPRCRAQIAAGEVDAVTFTSPSAVGSLASVFGRAGMATALRQLKVVSIGPTTTRALLDWGLTPSAQALPSTLDGVVAATLSVLRAE